MAAGFGYSFGGHRVFLSILLTFSTLSYFTESKFVDESRKKAAVIHRYIFTKTLTFSNLHKKIPHFVCSLQQEPEAHATGHVQMPDVVSARCNKKRKRMSQAMSRCQPDVVCARRYKNRKRRRVRGLPYLREILRLLTDHPKKPRTFPNEKYSPWQ